MALRAYVPLPRIYLSCDVLTDSSLLPLSFPLPYDPFIYLLFRQWDPEYRIKIRVICARAYHALFMHNMLIRPTAEELRDFGEPDFIIYNAGEFPANRFTKGMTSQTSVEINFKRMEMVILGTEYGKPSVS